MCIKLPYCAREIDPCIREEIEVINTSKQYRTLGSCCGHGKYPKTIVVLDRYADRVFEWYSQTTLKVNYSRGKRRKRWYKKDGPRKSDHYYIPEMFAISIHQSDTSSTP